MNGRNKKSLIRSTTEERYRSISKKQAPKLHSREVKDRILEHPLSKNELVDYLIRLQSSHEAIDRNNFLKLATQPQFAEIFKEV